MLSISKHLYKNLQKRYSRRINLDLERIQKVLTLLAFPHLELKKHNLPYVVVLTNPTTGGVSASWAMLGDILIAEPKAVVAFAGKRVIQDTVRETLPPDFQTAEYVKDHGGIDLVVERHNLRNTIGTLLSVL